MKKNYFLNRIIFCVFTLFLSVITYAQTNLYTQNFEGPDFDTYQLRNSGGTAVGFSINGSDYIQRNTITSLSASLGNTVTGFTGNVIAFEDHDGAGFFGQHSIDTDAINITGATGITLKIRLSAARGSDGNRYESGDFLQVQTSIDGGAFTTIINTGGTSTDNNYYEDVGMDGINTDANDVIINQNSREITAVISGTGASLVVRVLFDSQGPQEEILFDDIIVDAAAVLSIEDVVLEKALSVYPNPSNGNITIQNSGISLQGATIIDLNGRTVATFNLNGTTQNKTLDLRSVLTSGVYLMKIESESDSTVKRLVIK